MEKFFKPVHCPSGPEEIKLRKHHHHHHHHHQQDLPSHRYKLFDDTDGTESNREHSHHQHGHYVHENPYSDTHRRHPAQSFHPIEDDEILYNHDTPVTLSRASSSSLSSSSSSFSSSSWYTEASANDPFSRRHAERPQHSLSCSNIPDLRRGLRDDSNEPIVFASIKHGSKGNVCSLDGRTQQNVKCDFSTLDRGHSRSEEGLLQGNEDESEEGQSRVKNYRPLYKSSSLSRSLVFSEEDIQLGVSRGPKRAVSSIQLPSKGILKNREPHSDIRKARSMEVLSPRVAKGQECSGPKGKELNQANIERAKADFLQGKLQFSAFLDDITKQVMSPSHLSVLGVNRNKTPNKASTLTSDPIKPRLPPKKHRDGSGGSGEQKAKQPSGQEKTTRKSSDCSNPDKLISYAVRKHQGSPPPQQYPNSTGHNTHRGRGRKDKRPSPLGGPVSGDRYGRCGSQLTDGTSTSPEPTQPKQRLHYKQTAAFSIPRAHAQQFSQPLPEVVRPNPRQQGPSTSAPTTGGSGAQGDRVGLGSESSSSKSDSSRSRDTPSTATSHSSEKSGRHHKHLENSKQHRNTLFDADHLQALQEENSDLHQNLLQTVVCIESLESELQRTREELSTVKEKYKSLLETHGGSKPVNNLLGEHLHIVSESLGGDKKYLLNRVSQLSSELEDARRTISSLENINVPSLIKELVEKHFGSAETVQRFLAVSAPISHCASSPPADNHPHDVSKVVQGANDWLTKSEAAPQMVTAFVPFKQGAEGNVSSQHKSSYSPPFSVADISTAIYNKIAANYAARPPHSQSQQQPSLTTKYADSTLIPKQAHGGDSLGGKGEVKVTLLGEDVVDVTSMSAQQILDDFMQQLHAHKEGGGGNEQQGGQEWAGGMEQTGRVMD